MSVVFDRWRGKIALVTGASSGIGRAIAEDFGRLGMKVAVTGRRPDALAETAAAVRAAGGEALVLAGDQREAAVNRKFFADLAAHWGSVDVLVNNAGTMGGRSLLRDEWDELQSALDLNVRAALLCMREAAAAMRGKDPAAIINVSSMTGHRVVPGTPTVYAATKHALRILTDGLRSELVQDGQKVKVALLSPGLVDTPWHSKPDGLIALKGAYPYPPLTAADLVAAVRYVLAAPPGVQICDIQLRPSAQPF
ncbi:MAG: SDR family NAD(P)-dependent oxidoreductase [Opitutus sp.]|nr:SDR family NAD(P)-dependent oxidoreductase [Opitutus sp.]